MSEKLKAGIYIKSIHNCYHTSLIIVEIIDTLFDKNQSIWTYEHNQIVKENQKKREEYRKNNTFYDYHSKEIEAPKEKEKDNFER